MSPACRCYLQRQLRAQARVKCAHVRLMSPACRCYLQRQLRAQARAKCAHVGRLRWPQVQPAASCYRSLPHPHPRRLSTTTAHHSSETLAHAAARRKHVAHVVDAVGCDDAGTVLPWASELSSSASASAALMTQPGIREPGGHGAALMSPACRCYLQRQLRAEARAKCAHGQHYHRARLERDSGSGRC
jgi:hypothetical protein